MEWKLKKITIDKYIAIVLFVGLSIVPMVTNLYNTQIFGKMLTFMILALALDILWGYAGLMNLGFAVFFGLGGYVFGISLACQKGLPAFMQSLGELPWFYKPLQSVPAAILIGILLPALVALILGYFIFTSKIKGVFYNLITLAFAGLFELFITTNQCYTGGSSGVNGIATGLATLTIHGKMIDVKQWYYIAYFSLLVVYLVCLWMTECRFGKVIKSIRDNEARIQFLGYNPAVFKLAIFTIAGAIAGYAGVLYVPMTSFFSIESAGISFSTMILVWLAVGGRGNLTGAMFGALSVSFLQSYLSSGLGDIWQLVLGVILITVVLFLPNGVIGTAKNLQYDHRTRKQSEQV